MNKWNHRSGLTLAVMCALLAAPLAVLGAWWSPYYNRAPTISGTPAATVQVGTTYTFTPNASDPDRQRLTFYIRNKPAWASFSSGSGTLLGTPSSSDAGSYPDIRIWVSDGRAWAALPAFSILVTGTQSAPLQVVTTSLPDGRAGVSYQFALAAEGGSPPYTWMVSSGQLPAGIALGSGGMLSGTPASASVSTFSVSVRDANSASAGATYTLRIDGTSLAISTGPGLPDGQVGSPYSTTLVATGGSPPYRWQVTAGALPAGLTLNQSGQISGTPTSAASAEVTIAVTDQSSTRVTGGFWMQVLPAAVSITTTQLPDGAVNSAYSTTLKATGGTAPYRWQVTSGALPAGLSLNQNTGTISGTPTTAATSTVGITVSDANLQSANRNFGLTIDAAGTGWRLTWSDEFDGTTLDDTKWLNPTNDNSCNGYTMQKVMADDSYLDGNGHLVIRAQSRPTGGCGSTHLTAGQISTRGRFSQAYGRFEFRASMPAGGGGVWPALWLYPLGVSWPPEIDVIEAISDMSTMYMTYHWSSSNQQSSETYRDSRLATGYHTYTLEWEPGRIDWYIDGVKARSTFTGSNVSSMPMGILIDIYLGGWAGSVTASFPQYMYVDYVRVYARQ